MRAWLAKQGVRRTEPEFELRDALSQPGCPVCRLALRTVARQLDIIAYEAVNDLDLRARLRAARGFCNRHAWQFLEETRDPLGTALVYKDVVNTLIDLLSGPSPLGALAGLLDGLRVALAGRRPAPPRLPRGPLRALAPATGCPACAEQRKTEQLYLGLLAARPGAHACRESGAGPAGLCWPHLLQGLPQVADEPALLALVDARQRATVDRATTEGSTAPPGRDRLAGRLAAGFGHLAADRSALPPSLVVDVQRRRLEGVSRPGASPGLECSVCRSIAPDWAAQLAAAAHWPGREVDRLCGRHAWALLAGEPAALGEALGELERQRAAALAAELSDVRRSRLTPSAAGQRLAGRLAASAGCPLCAAWSRLNEGAVATAAGAGLAPLCLPHLLLAGRGWPLGDGWPALLARQVVAWRGLSADLAEYIRKHDYRFRLEPRGEEQASPWRAVELIAGPRGWSLSPR